MPVSLITSLVLLRARVTDPDLTRALSTVDHSAVKNRVMQWLSFKYGMVGELYWNTIYAF